MNDMYMDWFMFVRIKVEYEPEIFVDLWHKFKFRVLDCKSNENILYGMLFFYNFCSTFFKSRYKQQYIFSEERRNILKAHIKKIAAQQSRYLSDNYNFDYILECVDETKLNRNTVVDTDAEIACLVV